MAQKPDRTTAVQSVYNVSRTKVGPQYTVTTELYIEMSYMSNQRKLSSLAIFFICEVSQEVMAKFHQEPILYRKV
jgi:hypothetical protein